MTSPGGLSVVNVGRERPHLAAVGSVDPQYVSAVVLEGDTAAQVVRLFDYYRVQVNSLIPADLHEIVAAHIVARHKTECYGRDCHLARAWLGVASAAPGQASQTA